MKSAGFAELFPKNQGWGGEGVFAASEEGMGEKRLEVGLCSSILIQGRERGERPFLGHERRTVTVAPSLETDVLETAGKVQEVGGGLESPFLWGGS